MLFVAVREALFYRILLLNYVVCNFLQNICVFEYILLLSMDSFLR